MQITSCENVYLVGRKRKLRTYQAKRYETITDTIVYPAMFCWQRSKRITLNGNGIPNNIIDKIFLSFFTTKPTGQATGLGLSLSYDIITKEHNRTIKVESKKEQGATFIIQLPAR